MRFVAVFLAAVFFAAVFFAAVFFTGAGAVPLTAWCWCRIKRDLWRAAAFGWITFDFAARSSTLVALPIASTAVSGVSAIAARAVFTAVRAALRTALLRSRCRSFWRHRFSADFECANGPP